MLVRVTPIQHCNLFLYRYICYDYKKLLFLTSVVRIPFPTSSNYSIQLYLPACLMIIIYFQYNASIIKQFVTLYDNYSIYIFLKCYQIRANSKQHHWNASSHGDQIQIVIGTLYLCVHTKYLIFSNLYLIIHLLNIICIFSKFNNTIIII